MSEDIIKEYKKLKQKSTDLAELIIKHDAHLQKIKQEILEGENKIGELTVEIADLLEAKKEAEASENVDLLRRTDILKLQEDHFLRRLEQVIESEHKLEKDSEFLQVKRDALHKDLDAYEEKKKELEQVMVARDNALSELESLDNQISAHSTKFANEEAELQEKRKVSDQREVKLNKIEQMLEEVERILNTRTTETDALYKTNLDAWTELNVAKAVHENEVKRVAELEEKLITDRETLDSERKQLEHEKLEVEDKEIRLRNIIQQKGLEDRVNAGRKT